MSCTSPLKGWVVGELVSGARNVLVTSYGVDHLEFVNGNWIAVSCSMRGSLAMRVLTEFIELPCGKCVSCRLKHSREWADRCMLEAGYHKSSYFVTLTYSDERVPLSYYGMSDTGEALPVYTLRKRDFQLFVKRLRAALAYRGLPAVRFFGCGEYGSRTFRPHYHIIVFGLELSDLKVFSRPRDGVVYFTSEFLTDIWGNGHVVVSPVTWETCAYTARYALKKVDGNFTREHYEALNIDPEFVLMSRRPGIAKQYYDDNPDVVKNGAFVHTNKGARRLLSIKYFDRLYDLDCPESMKSIRERRKFISQSIKEATMRGTTLSYDEYLAMLDDRSREILSRLPREEF